MKTAIKNREGKNIVVEVEITPDQQGLVFIAHGLGGNKSEPQILTFAKAFHEEKYTFVRWDATHTFGESEGTYEDATVTNYLADLEDVGFVEKSSSSYCEFKEFSTKPV